MNVSRHAPIVTGKGKSRVVADIRAEAIALAPAPRANHREDDDHCRCRRCVFIMRYSCIQLFALRWSLEQIGQALNRKHQTVMYHCKPELRAVKNARAIAAYEATRTKPKRPYRNPDQQLWDNLGARHDAR